MIRSRDQLGRYMLHIHPEMTFSYQLGFQEGMVGRTNPASTRETPECGVRIKQKRTRTEKNYKGGVSAYGSTNGRQITFVSASD